MGRTHQDLVLLFQIIDLEAWNFEPLAELDYEVMDVKTDTAAFKTPKKPKASVGVDDELKSVVELFPEDKATKFSTFINALKQKLRKEFSLDDKASREKECNVLAETMSDNGDMSREICWKML